MQRILSKILPAGLLYTSSLASMPVCYAQQGPSAAATSDVDIPFTQFVLPNGLTVVVHTDRRAPVVAINIMYRVGSANETVGRSGFAHLFEHLMFQGSENYHGEFFEPFRLAGTTAQNGTTNIDVTNYFETVPTPALDMALWMESDRMGHLLGAIDQKTLDEQRGVVENEKRQRYGQPGIAALTRSMLSLFPSNHPYGHLPIGSMADLSAATLEDVKTWFRNWYGPNNAVLVLAGDIDAKTAREKVTHYFGDIAPSAPVVDIPVHIPTLAKDTREVIRDRVPLRKLYINWPSPNLASQDEPALFVIAALMTQRYSYLYRALVEAGLANDVGGIPTANKLAGTFAIQATLKENADVAEVERIIHSAVRRMAEEGPTGDDLKRASFAYRSGLIRSLENVGTKGGVLARCAALESKPDCWRDDLAAIDRATPARLREVARKWLLKPSHTILVEPDSVAPPLPEDDAAPAGVRNVDAIRKPDTRFRAFAPGVDRRSGVPKPTGFPDFKLPQLQHAALSNGIKVIVVEQHELPIVTAYLMMPAAAQAADAVGAQPYRSTMAFNLLQSGAGAYDAAALTKRKEELGVSFTSRSGLDAAGMLMFAVKEKLPESLDLLADLVLRPTFDQGELDRKRASLISSLQGAKKSQQVTPIVLPRLLYGAGHPYGTMLTEALLAKLSRDDLVAFQRDRMRPDGATIIVVGDTSAAQIVPLLEARFGQWTPAQLPASSAPAQVPLPPSQRIFLIDQPGAAQSLVTVAQVVPGTPDSSSEAFDAANHVLGGDVIQRLSANLREDKHWTYGAYSAAGDRLGQRQWTVSTSVQVDKTAESMAEVRREISDLATGKKPVSPAEMERYKSTIYKIPARLASMTGIAIQIADNVRYGLPEDYLKYYAERLKVMAPSQATTAFEQAIHPESLTWVIVGPRDKIEAQIRALGFGNVILIDGEAAPIDPDAAHPLPGRP